MTSTTLMYYVKLGVHPYTLYSTGSQTHLFNQPTPPPPPQEISFVRFENSKLYVVVNATAEFITII